MASHKKTPSRMSPAMTVLMTALLTDELFADFEFKPATVEQVLKGADGEYFAEPSDILAEAAALEANGFPADKIKPFFRALTAWISKQAAASASTGGKDKKSGGGKKDGKEGGGLDTLLSKLARKMGADDLYEALDMLAHNPRDQHARAQWRKHAGDQRLIVEGDTTGSIDKKATRRAIDHKQELGQAPKRIDGKLLLNLGELLQKVYVADPFSGRPIVGDGEILGIDQYTWEGFPGVVGLTMAKAQEHPLLLLAALAHSENMVRDPVQMMSELRNCFRGTSDLPQLSGLRTHFLGTSWAPVYEVYERDQRTGGGKLTAAKAKLQCTLAPNPRPASIEGEAVDPLSILFGGGSAQGEVGGSFRNPHNWG